jgi:hypothetical protein
MADTKITALTAITTVDPAVDVLPIVDVSDTTMAASGTTKKITSNQILGAGGTATLASATITGAATVGTTLGVTGASALGGSVGIGAAASAKLSVTDANGIPIRFGDLAAAPASQTACFVGVSTSAFPGHGNGDLILVPRTSDNRDVIIYTGSGTAAERLRVTAAGNVNITTGNVVMATSGKGIDFSATTEGSGTMTSELLNDYEEGTFTPSLATDDINFTSVGYTTQTAKYTKVGNLVTIAGTIQTSSVVKGLANGAVVITGLPFTQPSTDARGGVNCFASSSWLADAPLSGDISGTRIFLLKRATSVSASANLAVADVSTGAANNIVRFSGQYYV